MIRRSPTKIDLRLDDLQEFDELYKNKETKKDGDKQAAHNLPSWGGKVTQTEIQERIGYMPQTPHTNNVILRRSNMTL